ncbi:MAG: hypothetical protein LBT11_06930 [Treponema sp.]|jgi:hypothetical protein|nr:hypothetical protein [Treponema sp.]
MSKRKITAISFALFTVLFLSTSPIVHFYGGKIWFINNSSHNLLLEFSGGYSIYNNIESKVYIEKQERLPINHIFLDPEAANPNVFFTQLKIYDVDTGDLLNELHSTEILFTLEDGSTALCDAEFSFQINDSLF